jgi:hypothetical protein
MAFAIFLAAVAIYIAFLIWCFAPLRRFPRVGFTGWLRLALGSMLLAANISPIFALPVLLPVAHASHAISPPFAGKILTVVMFMRTAPIYISNVVDRVKVTATVFEVEFPLTIGESRYRPRLRIVCTHRQMISADKGVRIVAFEQYPTIVSDDLVAKIGTTTVVFGSPGYFCSPTDDKKLEVGPYPRFRDGIGPPSVFVLRGEADRTQFYELRFEGQRAAVDDLALDQPRVVRIEQRPASEVVPVAALWPMARHGEMSLSTPAVAWAYRTLGVPANACVENIRADMDFRTLQMTGIRGRSTQLRDMAPSQRADFCRRELAKKIPPVVATELSPTAE